MKLYIAYKKLMSKKKQKNINDNKVNIRYRQYGKKSWYRGNVNDFHSLQWGLATDKLQCD